MDEIDRSIIELLKKDAATPLSKIADIIGVPRPTVYLRFNKMKEDGVIKGFNIVLGRESEGPLRAAVIRVKDYILSEIGPRAMKKLGERLSKRTEVVFAAKISRNSIFVLWEGGSLDFSEYDEIVSVEKVEPEVYKGA